jgi:bisphosphoglycerate-independent phosphoglycerate mutase (AlkP superfamily)
MTVFFKNIANVHAMEHCKNHGTALHCWPTLSGGVHSHYEHLWLF